MKLEKTIDIIDTKLNEIKALFPVELGSGKNAKLSKECQEFRANIASSMENLRKIEKIVNK